MQAAQEEMASLRTPTVESSSGQERSSEDSLHSNDSEKKSESQTSLSSCDQTNNQLENEVQEGTKVIIDIINGDTQVVVWE